MFGIGFQEMLIILVVVLIFFGPKRLPDLAKSLGKGIAEFKKASDEVRKGIDEAVREEETDETMPDAPPPGGEPREGPPPSGDEPPAGSPPSSASDPAPPPSTPKA
jgi:TatA/E family protein of Tat protein translocase